MRKTKDGLHEDVGSARREVLGHLHAEDSIPDVLFFPLPRLREVMLFEARPHLVVGKL